MGGRGWSRHANYGEAGENAPPAHTKVRQATILTSDTIIAGKTMLKSAKHGSDDIGDADGMRLSSQLLAMRAVERGLRLLRFFTMGVASSSDASSRRGASAQAVAVRRQ